MSKPNTLKFFKTVGLVLKKHSPEILTAVGITGMVGSTVLAVRATPKALRLIEEAKNHNQVEKLTPVETVKATWKCYVPSVISGVTSAVCLIGANTVHARRTAALATAYTLSESALREYKDKVVETIGEKKEQTIREQIVQDRVDKREFKPTEIIITDKGDTLFLDSISDRLFKSDRNTIMKAVNEINYRMTCDILGSASLSDFYDEIGLDHTAISDKMGWNLENGKGLLHVDLVPASKDDKPCFMLDYNVIPNYEFANYY